MIYLLKLGYAWVLPPGLFILVLVLSLLFIKRKAVALLLTGLVIYVCSIGATGDTLLETLEQKYLPPTKAELKTAQAIVVLGGGSVGGVEDFDGTGQVYADAGNRLLMGLRLHRELKLPIVLSGGTVFSYHGNEAEISARLLKACGVKESKLLKETKSRNTVENARYTKELCQQKGYDRVILVTSAYHLPRSVAIYEREGVKVLPYPTDYKVAKPHVLDAFAFTPQASDMKNVATALREYLGLVAIKCNLQ